MSGLMENIDVPTVSIITPTFNTSAFIGRCIESVLQQSFFDWEMIIVDDGSTDRTVEVIKYYSNRDSRIKLIELSENSGPAVARNRAISLASGRYIAFLDGDDIWFPRKLERQIWFMRENGFVFTYTGYKKINHCDEIIGEVGVPEKISYKILLKSCSIGCLTVIYDTSFFGKVYMPSLPKRQDFALWLVLLRRTSFAHGLNVALASYRVHNGSISANKFSAAFHTWRMFRDVERMNFFWALYYFSHYALRGLVRSKMTRLGIFLGFLRRPD